MEESTENEINTSTMWYNDGKENGKIEAREEFLKLIKKAKKNKWTLLRLENEMIKEVKL